MQKEGQGRGQDCVVVHLGRRSGEVTTVTLGMLLNLSRLSPPL